MPNKQRDALLLVLSRLEPVFDPERQRDASVNVWSGAFLGYEVDMIRDAAYGSQDA